LNAQDWEGKRKSSGNENQAVGWLESRKKEGDMNAFAMPACMWMDAIVHTSIALPMLERMNRCMHACMLSFIHSCLDESMHSSMLG
jgi:hypothetical protein